jgi:tellurite resistance-related uncharacterized protein
LKKAWAKRQQVAMNPNVPCKCKYNVPNQLVTNKENIQHVGVNTHKTTKANRVLVKVIKGKWTYYALKEAVEVVERGINIMRKASRNWGIPFFFLGHHLNGKIKSIRIGFRGVLTNEENVAIVR